MLKKVVRCDACTRVHDLKDLLELRHLANGTSTFTCPNTKSASTYKLESVGTLHTADGGKRAGQSDGALKNLVE